MIRTDKIRVIEEDGSYVGLSDEYPKLSWISHNEEEALNGIKKLVSYVKRDMKLQEL